MPLFYQQNINDTTRLAIWKIEETEDFFSGTVPLQREITHPHKRLQHLAARYLLRFLFPAFPYDEIMIASTRKPFLPDEQFHFSISHCGDYAAAIVSSTDRVGIDIEIPTDKVLKIAHKFLSEEEITNFNIQHPTSNIQHPTSSIQQLTLLWSAKEAIYKWWGNGEVDFREMMRLESFEMQSAGSFNGWFQETALQINYEMFDRLCLAWVSSTSSSPD
jgi:phosphopantetheinyl transferase